MQNKYYYRAKVSEAKFRQLLKLFSVDIESVKIAKLTGLNRRSIDNILRKLRLYIAEFCEQESPFSGTVEVDESYFGAKRVKGKAGRGAYGKTPVFGIFKRNGKVYTQIVPDCSKATLQAIIRGKVDIGSVINSDGWGGYDGLVDVGYERHFRVNHSADEFVRGKTHINGIEGCWGYAKVRLAKFRGMHKNTFYLHLKETEFRYNYRNYDLYKLLLALLKNNPLN